MRELIKQHCVVCSTIPNRRAFLLQDSPGSPSGFLPSREANSYKYDSEANVSFNITSLFALVAIT